jgi:MFS family permease
MSDVATTAAGPVRAPTPAQVASIVVGNALEFYDFLTYSFFAAQIGQSFFPSKDPATNLLASLATFGAGFLTRPVGAFVIGRMADKVGRKPAMLLSFGLMGLAIIGLALTPPFRVIGWAAPGFAILFRLVQGFALGGELGPNTAYLLEAAPPGRRGVYVSLQFMSQDAAVLCAGLMGVVLSNVMDAGALRDWGWRIAFLAGAVIVPFGFMLRRELVETLHQPEPAAGPAAPGAQSYRRIAAIGLVLLASGTVVTYVMNYLNTFANQTLHMASNIAFGATVAFGLSGVCFDVLGGWLSDRFGRKPVMMIPWALLGLATLPCFWAVVHYRTAVALFAATAVMGILSAIASSSVLISVTESLPKRVRSQSLALVYAVAISIFGGTAQFNVALFTKLTHSSFAPAWYMTAAILVGFLAMLTLRETAPLVARSKPAAAPIG